MGAAINALRDIGTVFRNSPTFIPTCFLAGVILLIGLVLALVPIVGPFLYGFVITPLVLVGLVSTADAALDGQGSFSEFVGAIQENASDAVTAYGVLAILNIAIGLGVVIIGIIVGAGVLSVASVAQDGPSAAFGAGIGLSTIVLTIGLLLVYSILTLIQVFLDTAVVISDKGGFEAVKQAWYVLRYGPLSCIGYSIIRGVITVVAVIPSLVLFGAAVGMSVGAPGDPSGTGAVPLVLGLVGVVLLPLPLSVSIAYHTGYYRRRLSSFPADTTTTEPTPQPSDPQNYPKG